MASEQSKDVEVKDTEAKSDKVSEEDAGDTAKGQRDKDLLTYEGKLNYALSVN